MITHAITFDDVLLVPAYNAYESRRDVDFQVTDRRNKLTLSFPVMSSNMDTITESKMANFMHSKGGIGALHRFLTVEDNISQFKACEGPTFVSVGCTAAELERALRHCVMPVLISFVLMWLTLTLNMWGKP